MDTHHEQVFVKTVLSSLLSRYFWVELLSQSTHTILGQQWRRIPVASDRSNLGKLFFPYWKTLSRYKYLGKSVHRITVENLGMCFKGNLGLQFKKIPRDKWRRSTPQESTCRCPSPWDSETVSYSGLYKLGNRTASAAPNWPMVSVVLSLAFVCITEWSSRTQ